MKSEVDYYQSLARHAATQLTDEWLTKTKELTALAEHLSTCEVALPGVRAIAKSQHLYLTPLTQAAEAIAQRPNVSVLFLKRKT